MTHLVANPPPAEFWDPSKSPRFSVLTADGVADVLAWGISTTEAWKVDIGPGDSLRVTCDNGTFDAANPSLCRFKVSGLWKGDNIALYKKAVAAGSSWLQYSGFVPVDTIAADHWGANYIAGTLPKWAGNPNIQFYPFGSLQHHPPIDEAAWMDSVRSTLNTINANALGAAILKLVPASTTIHPYIRPDKNANSTILFTPANFQGSWEPGSSADEILLHEFIHVIENNANGYVDASGFLFDTTDFMSVNATNVYSCLLGRGLRKDHHGYNSLPNDYFSNPKKHFDEFKANYTYANGRNSTLYNAVKNNSNYWNPFKFL